MNDAATTAGNSATGDGSGGHIVFLYPFRFLDPVTRRWVRTPQRAERRDIERRYAHWEITGGGDPLWRRRPVPSLPILTLW
jgi:hypothetical protein